jgi:hypothetical protein
MRRATSRPLRKPPKQAISQILKYLRAVSSSTLQGTLAPMLNTSTSIAPMRRFDLLDQGHDLFFLAGVAAKGHGPATLGFDLRHQRRQAAHIAPGHASGVALARETAGNCAAGGVTRADDQYDR